MRELFGINEIRIMKTVCESGPISRATLARQLHLSRAAVTLITQRLVERDLLTEVGKGTSTERGGRREVFLDVHPGAGLILAAQIERDYSKFGLLNIAAKAVAHETVTYAPGAAPAAVLGTIAAGLTKMLAAHHIPKKKIAGMGAGIPGILNYASGVLREAETLSGWQDFPVQKFLEERLGIPVYLENDVKALTLGEFQFGSGRKVRDLVCVAVADGIGAGLIVNGSLLRGATSSAGEIGYNEFFFGQPGARSLLVNGRQRDWGDILSHSNLKEAVARGKRDGWTTRLRTDCRIEDIIEAAEASDPLALHLIELFGKLLGAVCINLIYCFNPPVVILHGPLFYRTALVADEVRHHVAQGLLRSPVEAVEIRTGMLGDNAVLMGAAALVLEHLFQFNPATEKRRSPRHTPQQAP